MGSLHEGGTVGADADHGDPALRGPARLADNHTRWTYRELGDAAGRMSRCSGRWGSQRATGWRCLRPTGSRPGPS